jgi:hypothetical protein
MRSRLNSETIIYRSSAFLATLRGAYESRPNVTRLTFLILNLAVGFYNVGTVWANEVDIFDGVPVPGQGRTPQGGGSGGQAGCAIGGPTPLAGPTWPPAGPHLTPT